MLLLPAMDRTNSLPAPSTGDEGAWTPPVSLPPVEELLYLQLKELDLPALTIFFDPDHEGSQNVLDWARACKELAGDNFELVPVEHERYPTLARWWGVTALPAVLLLLDGKVVDRLEGDYSRFSHWIAGGPVSD